MPFDVDRIRSGYPALTEGFLHFDGAGGTQPAEPVISAVASTMRTAVSNRGAGFEPARRSGEIVAGARAAVADLVGGVPDGVAFGPSATALTYLVARTLGRQWTSDDEIVVSRLDHDANVRPWVQAAQAAGATVRWAAVDTATGRLPVEQYERLINARTRLVAVTAASNANGAVPAVRQIADLAHGVGSLTYVDGVHATAHLPVDVAALGADFYVTSAYKWSGPHYAAVVASPETWEPLHPLKLVPSPDVAPDRFEFGTLSFELLAGMTAAVDHLATLAPRPGSSDRRENLVTSMAEVGAYENGLAAKLAAGLAGTPGVSVVPAPDHRCPTIAFRVAGQSPAQTARILGDQGICVSNGDYYAVEFFTATGLRDSGGAVRASIYHYNTAAEVDRLLEAIGEISGALSDRAVRRSSC
jgi:cysteine desulfurase family protein (TIGR01976 family)